MYKIIGMKKIWSFILSIFILLPFNTVSKADDDPFLTEASKRISETIANLVPGEGLTEVEIEIKEKQEPNFTILGVRDISKTDNSNLFTQFSLHNNDIIGDERYIGNLGFGYRILTDDQSMMLGVNAFYDRDFREDHERGSIGLEARGSGLDFNFNYYEAFSAMQTIDGTEEQQVGGIDYNLTTQVPYAPWAKLNYHGYTHHKDKATQYTVGNILSLEMAINPSLQLDISRDKNGKDPNLWATNLSFIYPPRSNDPTLKDGLLSDEFWFKESMQKKLSDKVRRNNNLAVEVQGSVIITKN